MRFVLTSDVHDFAERTAGLFAGRPECNLPATVLQGIVHGHYANATPVLAYGLDDQHNVRFAALRTPPWPMLATELDRALAAGLIGQWLAADPELPGVNALAGTARAIAAAWRDSSGGRTSVRMRQAMHVLDEVREPARPALGRLRPADSDERELLVGWVRAFFEEAVARGGFRAIEFVDAQLAHGRLFVWDRELPVSMAATAPRFSGATRIGPVYTPPDQRRRGYATTMVAALSRRALAAGADRCVLYTDRANPTSNKIYAEIGYRQVSDWEEHVFERA